MSSGASGPWGPKQGPKQSKTESKASQNRFFSTCSSCRLRFEFLQCGLQCHCDHIDVVWHVCRQPSAALGCRMVEREGMRRLMRNKLCWFHTGPATSMNMRVATFARQSYHRQVPTMHIRSLRPWSRALRLRSLSAQEKGQTIRMSWQTCRHWKSSNLILGLCPSPKIKMSLRFYVPMLQRLGDQWESYGFCVWCDQQLSAHNQIEQHHLKKIIMLSFKFRIHFSLCVSDSYGNGIAA